MKNMILTAAGIVNLMPLTPLDLNNLAQSSNVALILFIFSQKLKSAKSWLAAALDEPRIMPKPMKCLVLSFSFISRKLRAL